jgi:hypothetical protein
MKAQPTLALSFLLLAASQAACGHDEPTPAGARPPPVSLRDFFLFACQNAYAKAHGFPLFDNSLGYAVEFSTASGEELDRVYKAAEAFGLSLRAPDPKDSDHGGVAVSALCLQESRSQRVDALVTPRPRK